MLILCWLLGSVINDIPNNINKIMQFSGLFEEKMEEISEDDNILTEPIMDASFLDDEINMLNDEFSSWKLTVHRDTTNTTTTYPHPLGLYSGNNINETSLNNNTLLDNFYYNNYDDQQHGETIASITGSILEQLEFDDDDDFEPQTGSIKSSMNKHELLFSPPEKSFTLLKSNFSTDSLDKSALLEKLNRMTTHDNYTIAFQSQEESIYKKKKRNFKSILTQSCPNYKHFNSQVEPHKKLAEILTKTKQIQTSDEKILVCYPNYVLPDLEFLQEKKSYTLVPQKLKKVENVRPLSCNDVEMLRKANFSHVKDWDSLNFLLPQEYREIILDNCKPVSEREKVDPFEKEVDTVVNSGGGGGVVLRRNKKLLDPKKRYSCNNEKKVNKFKRFSLQEIQEITEITSDISQTLKDFEDIREEKLHYNTPCNKSIASDYCGSSIHHNNNNKCAFFEEKTGLTSAITQGVNQLMQNTKQQGGKTIYSNSSHGKLVLESLCPALFSLLSDGLAPFLETIFGRVPNTVWRVVEASIQCGPTAQSLNELVLRINSEQELMAEGPVKFNAFICGLLNLRSLTSWLTFLRTKDRLLRTHYDQSGLLYQCNTSTRSMYDQMLVNTLALSKINYSLDIFHETKQLHQKMNQKHQKNYKKNVSLMKRSFSDERPKRKPTSSSNNLPKSKTQHFHKSSGRLESCSKKDNEVTPDKFKKLQLQWELLSSTSSGGSNKVTSPTACTGSKIPRPIIHNNNNKNNVRPSSAFTVFNK